MWFRYANGQLELFPREEMELTEDERRRRDLTLLPGHEDHLFGPFYHGSPVMHKIINNPHSTGLGTEKTPMFGGINEPLSSGLYFGVDKGIADQYAAGSVRGQDYHEIYNMRSEFLPPDWSEEDVLSAQEDQYDDFERAVEDYNNESGDAWSFTPAQIARILWDSVRGGEEDSSGVASFYAPLTNVEPDEDFLNELISSGAKSASGMYHLNKMLHPEYLQEYEQRLMIHFARDLEKYISSDPDLAEKLSEVDVSDEDVYEIVDKLVEVIKSRYYDEDGRFDAEMLDDYDMLAVADEYGEETAISMELSRELSEIVSPEVWHGLGILSAGSVGKAATEPIPVEEYGRRKVKVLSQATGWMKYALQTFSRRRQKDVVYRPWKFQPPGSKLITREKIRIFNALKARGRRITVYHGLKSENLVALFGEDFAQRVFNSIEDYQGPTYASGKNDYFRNKIRQTTMMSPIQRGTAGNEGRKTALDQVFFTTEKYPPGYVQDSKYLKLSFSIPIWCFAETQAVIFGKEFEDFLVERFQYNNENLNRMDDLPGRGYGYDDEDDYDYDDDDDDDYGSDDDPESDADYAASSSRMERIGGEYVSQAYGRGIILNEDLPKIEDAIVDILRSIGKTELSTLQNFSFRFLSGIWSGENLIYSPQTKEESRKMAISGGPEIAYELASNVDKEFSQDTWDIAKQDPDIMINYLLYVPGAKDDKIVDEARNIAINDPFYAMYFAKRIDGCPSSETWNSARMGLDSAVHYAIEVPGAKDFPEIIRGAHQAMLAKGDATLAYKYAVAIDEKASRETWDITKKFPHSVMSYILYVPGAKENAEIIEEARPIVCSIGLPGGALAFAKDFDKRATPETWDVAKTEYYVMKEYLIFVPGINEYMLDEARDIVCAKNNPHMAYDFGANVERQFDQRMWDIAKKEKYYAIRYILDIPGIKESGADVVDEARKIASGTPEGAFIFAKDIDNGYTPETWHGVVSERDGPCIIRYLKNVPGALANKEAVDQGRTACCVSYTIAYEFAYGIDKCPTKETWESVLNSGHIDYIFHYIKSIPGALEDETIINDAKEKICSYGPKHATRFAVEIDMGYTPETWSAVKDFPQELIQYLLIVPGVSEIPGLVESSRKIALQKAQNEEEYVMRDIVLRVARQLDRGVREDTWDMIKDIPSTLIEYLRWVPGAIENKQLVDRTRDVICESKKFAFSVEFATMVDKGFHPKTWNVVKDSRMAMDYLQYVPGAKDYPELVEHTRRMFLDSPRNAYIFARDIVGHVEPDTWEVARKDAHYAYEYMANVPGTRDYAPAVEYMEDTQKYF